MTINNELLAKFEGKCWHAVKQSADVQRIISVPAICSCGVICDANGPMKRHIKDSNPSYSTSPDDRERLWGYLMGKEEMWKAFKTAILTAKIGEPYDTDLIVYLFSFIDGAPRWVGLLSEWLGMDETVERFGKVKCSNCIAGVEESGPTFIKECTVCDGSGRVLAPWAREAKEGK